MTHFIRAALLVLSLATTTPVANAVPNAPAPVQQDWSNGETKNKGTELGRWQSMASSTMSCPLLVSVSPISALQAGMDPRTRSIKRFVGVPHLPA
jgi:hypothetical protein